MHDIVLENVTKSYDGKIRAVDDLSVELPGGEFICLLGPSGCGKTTTLRMIAGLERPDAGEIRFGDEIFESVGKGSFLPPEKRRLGLMFQSYALWPHMTVGENITFGLDMEKVSAPKQKKRLAELLVTFQLEGMEKRYINELSGGQQQRVALARMMAVQPSLLLLDEPLSNLDARLRLEMRAQLKQLHRSMDATIVFVTHDQFEAMTLGTSIVVMDEGRIQQIGTPMECYLNPKNRFVAEFLGSPPMNIIEQAQHSEFGRLCMDAWKSVNGRLNVDRGASIGFRPEAVELIWGAFPCDDFTVGGFVETVLPTGSNWIVGVRVADQAIYAITPVAPEGPVGSNVAVRVDKNLLHCFDESGENAKIAGSLASL